MSGTLSSKFLYAGFGKLDHLYRSSLCSPTSQYEPDNMYLILERKMLLSLVATAEYSKKTLGKIYCD